MNQTEMLHQMCHDVLTQADVRAICKTRGLPSQAADSRGLLESLFVSDTGLAAAFGVLDPLEIALLHLLKAVGKPVNIAFFRRLDPAKAERFRYDTFTRRHQGVLALVKERLVRRGVLLLAVSREAWSKKLQMERWLFALPTQFAPHLPPLIMSPRDLRGEGNRRDDVVRAKLKTAVARSARGDIKDEKVEIVDRQLLWGGQPFRATQPLDWQKRRWQEEIAPRKPAPSETPYALSPSEAVLQILGSLGDGQWADAEKLAAPLEIFCGSKVDAQLVCEAGWRWGCLARQQAEGKTWYRLPPSMEGDVPPHQYCEITADGTATVDLETIPFEALEDLVAISDLRAASAGSPVLLVMPNLIKLGQMADRLSTLPLADWLQKNSSEFQQAIETLRQRSGKTILHENLAVARVSDLALKVAIQKALGTRIVSLGEEYIAFPRNLISDVNRVVIKSGHVIKEASDRDA